MPYTSSKFRTWWQIKPYLWWSNSNRHLINQIVSLTIRHMGSSTDWWTLSLHLKLPGSGASQCRIFNNAVTVFVLWDNNGWASTQRLRTRTNTAWAGPKNHFILGFGGPAMRKLWCMKGVKNSKKMSCLWKVNMRWDKGEVVWEWLRVKRWSGLTAAGNHAGFHTFTRSVSLKWRCDLCDRTAEGKKQWMSKGRPLVIVNQNYNKSGLLRQNKLCGRDVEGFQYGFWFILKVQCVKWAEDGDI